MVAQRTSLHDTERHLWATLTVLNAPHARDTWQARGRRHEVGRQQQWQGEMLWAHRGPGAVS